MEELSDRIIVKALTDAQKDIAEGSPLIDNITREVLLPRRDMLCQWVSSIAVHLGHSIADDNVGEVVRQHIKDNVAAAVHGNTQVSALKLVPVMGHLLEQQLSDAVADIVINSVVNLLQQMTPEKVDEIVQHGLTAPTQSEQALDKEMLLVINESLDLVKAHISTQRWKEKL